MSQPGKLYDVVKTHKENYPIRPVLSAINILEYNLGKTNKLHVSCLTNIVFHHRINF